MIAILAITKYCMKGYGSGSILCENYDSSKFRFDGKIQYNSLVHNDNYLRRRNV